MQPNYLSVYNEIGLKIEVKMNMKLPDKYGSRLHTKNFRRVTSEAANSIDYDSKLKIIEIEYKTRKIYHYLDMNKEVWNKFLEVADKGKGLGVYINQDFKNMITEYDYDYYELINNVISLKSFSKNLDGI
jgi:hypothetical protein